MTLLFRVFFFVLGLSLSLGASSFAQNPDVKIIVEFARDGERVLAATRVSIPPEYHTYAHEPGGMGLPTKLDFSIAGEKSAPTLYPAGTVKADPLAPGTKVNVYTGEELLLTELPQDSRGQPYAATLEMLLCSSKHCLPYKETIDGVTPDSPPPLKNVFWASTAKALLREAGEIPVAAKNDPSPSATGAPLQGKDDANVVPAKFDLDLDPQYAEPAAEIYSLGQAILLGIFAGLLLNAMPCVLPVLTMKVSGILLMGGVNNKESVRAFRMHNIWFSLGVMTFFTFLAIVLAGADLMWGQLYQNQAVILCMLILVFLMGLSMLGVFNLPVFDLKLGTNVRNPELHSFLTGLVSTFLATPCSGPLLGGALAWALSQTVAVTISVFWAIGAGMALPYLIFSIWPNLIKILPRPGSWMYALERALGFLLLGTALYLLTILPQDKRVSALAVLLVLAAGAWLWGKFCGLNASSTRRRVCGVCAVALVCAAVVWILKPPAPDLKWQNFSPDVFTAELGRKNMLVEFTADWCPNCKFLESTVLSGKSMRGLQKNYDLELVRVDLTRDDPYAQRLLQMLGGKSIPLTAIFPQGPDASRPIVLRDVYGKKTLNKALRELLDGV